jgi:Putative DNA-binding domain
MIALRLVQKRFAAALLDADRDAPRELRQAGRRFAVYRNNLRVSLTDGLVARFPLCHALVGEAFFRAMAARFLELCPPRSPILATWGDDLPAFIELFPPARTLPYLADCARLEIARTEAYHAADAAPLEPAELTAVTPDEWDDVRVTLHPSVRVVSSRHPIGTIWRLHAGPRGPALAGWEPEDVLVVRPASDVLVSILPRGGAAFLESLGGTPVGRAARAARASPAFDLVECLSLMVRQRLIVALRRG